MIFFRLYEFSAQYSEYEIHIGQNIPAKKRNIYTLIRCIELVESPLFSVIQTAPSQACCIPKKRGVDANGITLVGDAFLIDKIPIVDKPVAAIKLAFAEKHIICPFIYLRHLKAAGNTFMPKLCYINTIISLIL